MRYKSFRIQNYKAIKDLTVQLDGQNLVPIIGLNETGKSSILQAIFSFDFFNDDQYNKDFINFEYIRNRFETQRNPIIEAKIENVDTIELINNAVNYIITQKEKDFIEFSRYKNEKGFNKREYLNSFNKKLFSFLENKISNITKESDFKIAREFSISQNGLWNNKYKILNLFIQDIEENIIVNGIYEEEIRLFIQQDELEQLIGKSILINLPRIIYIDDFKDEIPY